MRVRSNTKRYFFSIITIGIFLVLMLYSSDVRDTFKFFTGREFFPSDRTNDIVIQSSCNTSVGTFPTKYSSESPVFQNSWGAFGTETGKFFHPSDIKLDSNSNVYVLDSDNSLNFHRIQKFSQNGDFVREWNVAYDNNEGTMYFSDILIDSDDNILVHDSQNDVMQKFSNNGEFIETWNTSEKETFVGFTIDSLDYTYGLTDRKYVKKWSTDGERVATWYLDNYDEFKITNAQDIAIDKFDQIYVLDNSTIHKFDCDGNHLSSFALPLPTFFSGIPQDIFIDSSGFLYVTASFSEPEILKFSNEGKFVTHWSIDDSENKKFTTAQRLMVTTKDQIFVIDTENYQIIEFNSES